MPMGAGSSVGSSRVRDFAYHRPVSIEAALTLLASPDARPLSGGTDLVPQLREARRTATHIVDLKAIAELRRIDVDASGGVTIGAAVSASAIADHPLIAHKFPAVAMACRLIGSWQIQNRATLGGNVCNAAPSADGVPPLVCYGAIARVASRDGPRQIRVEEMFEGPGRTSLKAGDLLTALYLPPPPERSATAYLRFTPRREMDIAVVGVGAYLALGEGGRIAGARLALASVAPTPIRATAAEAALVGQPPSMAVLGRAAQLAAEAARPISDTRGSADYRRHLVGVLTRRVLDDCLKSLGVTIEAA